MNIELTSTPPALEDNDTHLNRLRSRARVYVALTAASFVSMAVWQGFIDKPVHAFFVALAGLFVCMLSTGAAIIAVHDHSDRLPASGHQCLQIEDFLCIEAVAHYVAQVQGLKRPLVAAEADVLIGYGKDKQLRDEYERGQAARRRIHGLDTVSA